jgi:hypothetical protein
MSGESEKCVCVCVLKTKYKRSRRGHLCSILNQPAKIVTKFFGLNKTKFLGVCVCVTTVKKCGEYIVFYREMCVSFFNVCVGWLNKTKKLK